MSTGNPYTELNQQSREDLVMEHAPQIKRIVTRMAARFPPGVDQEELYQAGMMGLLDALEKFEPPKEVQEAFGELEDLENEEAKGVADRGEGGAEVKEDEGEEARKRCY